VIAVGVAGAAAAGAVARYLTDRAITRRHSRSFPFGTFTINVLGSFLFGLVTALATHHHLSTTSTTVIGAGFCGGFTTWSTYCWETLALLEAGAPVAATLNVFGSLVAGFAAAAAGLALGAG
jgi:CrcB protein